MQVLPGGLRPTHGHAGGESDRIHCAGAGGADRLYSEPTILEQMIDHAPDKGAMRATALEGEIHVFQGIAHFWNFAPVPSSAFRPMISHHQTIYAEISLRTRTTGCQPMALSEEKQRDDGQRTPRPPRPRQE